MGREARRVPLDFDWPQGQTWPGYLQPDSLHGDPCPDCVNGGTYASSWLQKVAYIIAGLADDASDEARGRAMHPYLEPLRNISYGGLHNATDPRPGPEFAQFADGLNPDRRPSFLGRDTYGMYGALHKAANLPDNWGTCQTCDGHATTEAYPGQRAESDAWEPTEPPTGDGWQMWETTSEGSPMSPVFATPQELAQWLADTGASMFGATTATTERWLNIITGEDFAHVQIAPGVVIM